jgi:DNA polymerase-3 subunit delta'
MVRLLREGDPAFALRGTLADQIGARPDRDRMQATLELARAVLAADLATASRNHQSRIISAHSALTTLAAQAPTYNFDPGLLAMEIGGLLASAAMPREAGSSS